MTRAQEARPPRKDQQRNRQRLLSAAQAAFLSGGADISLEDVAHRAGLSPSSLYRHFPTKEDLIEGVMDNMIEGVRANADRAGQIEDPAEAFRFVLEQSCRMTDQETVTFATLAHVSPRTSAHADRLIASVVGPATARLRAAGGLRPGITTADVVLFVRMVELAKSDRQRRKALDVLLAGLGASPPARP